MRVVWQTRSIPKPRWTPALATLALVLAACSQPADDASRAAPVELVTGSTCALDGMLLGDFPGPKAQIHYQGEAEPELFCDTVEMFVQYFHPEQVRPIAAIYVQDMGSADWEQPRGHWITAESAWYVIGSSRRGAMGRTLVPFADQAAAAAFTQQYGGKLARFAEISADQANLDGGVLHDQRM